MEIEEIIRKLRKARPEISREEFLKMVEERKKSLGNYFTEETIAKLVASEFGVKFSKKFEREFKTRIEHLVSGLNDVTVSGKILSIYPAQTFRRGLDKEGKVARLVIADQTGKINVVLWDEKADFAENVKLRKGQKIRISHGYVRESRRGGIELHVGEQGRIEIIKEKIGTKEKLLSFCDNVQIIERKTRKLQLPPIDYVPRIRDAKPQIDPKKFKFEGDRLYKVVEIVNENTLKLDTGLLVSFLGINVDKRDETLQYLHDFILGKAVLLKLDDHIVSNDKIVKAYLYLKNKIFINAYLIKARLASPDITINHKYRDKFIQLWKGTIND